MKIYYDLVIIYLDYAGVSTGEITAFWTQLAFKKKKKSICSLKEFNRINKSQKVISGEINERVKFCWGSSQSWFIYKWVWNKLVYKCGFQQCHCTMNKTKNNNNNDNHNNKQH